MRRASKLSNTKSVGRGGKKTPAKPRSLLGSAKRPPREVYLEIVKEKYGRDPRRGEVIHHLDEDPFNNDPGNLVLLQRGIHFYLHRWAACGHLKTYRDELISAVEAFAAQPRSRAGSAKKEE